MVTSYTENPDNFYEVSELVESEAESIKEIFFSAKQIFFYDACSFQRHSNLPDEEKNILINYFKVRESAIFLTRCILMEISSDSHLLKDEFVCFLKALKANGIRIGIFDEEYTYDILSECFSTNEKVNEYLMWSVRTVKSPVGTIHKTLRLDKKLSAELIEGENLKQSGLYKKFFSAVRSNKERHDNLEEGIAHAGETAGKRIEAHHHDGAGSLFVKVVAHAASMKTRQVDRQFIVTIGRHNLRAGIAIARGYAVNATVFGKGLVQEFRAGIDLFLELGRRIQFHDHLALGNSHDLFDG